MLPSKDKYPRLPALLLASLVLFALFGWLAITSVVAQGPGAGDGLVASDSSPASATLDAIPALTPTPTPTPTPSSPPPPFDVPTGCHIFDFYFPVVGIYGQPDISADGGFLAFWSTAEDAGNIDGNIEVFASSTSTLTKSLMQVTHSTGGILGGFNLEPDTDATGSRIVFFSDRDLTGGNADANFEIFVYDLLAGAFTQVTNTRRGVNVSPSISADGRWVAFSSDQDLTGGNDDGNPEIFVYDMDTATFFQVTDTDPGINDQPAIDGAGDRIAFMTTANLNGGNPQFNQEIALYNVAAKTFDWVTHATVGDSDEPAISRDGTVVAFASNADLLPTGNSDGNYEIFVYDEAEAITLTQATSTTLNAVNDQPDLDGLGLLVAYVSDWDFENGGKLDPGTSTVMLYDNSVDSNRPLIYPDDGYSDHPSIAAGEANVAFAYNRMIYRVKCDPSILSLTKAGPTSVVAGTDITYTLTISNPGPLTAGGLKLVDIMPPTLSYGSVSTDCVVANNTVTCDLDDLGVKKEFEVVLTARVDPAARFSVTNFGHASAALAEPATATHTANITTKVGLSLTKEAMSPTVVAGERVTYTLVASNTGPSQATGVTLNDSLPLLKIISSTVTYSPPCGWVIDKVVCNLGALDPSASKTVTIAGTVNPDVDLRPFDNNATLTAVEPSPLIAAQARITPVAEADLELVKTGEPATVLAGEGLTYTLVLTNHGPSQASGVTLTDTLSNKLDWHKAAASPVCTIVGRDVSCAWGSPWGLEDSKTVTITAPVLPESRITTTNWAGAKSNATDPDPGNSRLISETTTINASVNLSLTKTAPAQASAGGQVTYTLQVINDGPSQATGVKLTDTLPPSTTYAWSSPGWCSAGGQIVTCALSEIDPGIPASKTVTIVADIDIEADGTIVNSAKVTAEETDSDPGNNEDTASSAVVRTADLKIFKSAVPSTVEAGTVLTYTISYRNEGPSSSDEVYMTDTLPSEVDYGGLVSSTGPLSVPQVSPPFLTWYTDTLPPTTTTYHKIVFTVTVEPEAQAGTISNTVAITSETIDPNPGKETFTKVTTVTTRAELSVVKWHEPEPSQTGAVLTYTLIYTNAGPSTAHDTVLTDSLPPGLDFQGMVTSPVSLTGPDPLALPDQLVFTGTLPASSGGQPYTETLSFEVLVRQDVSAPLTNTVEITSSAQDSQPDYNRFEDPAAIMSDLAILKYSTPPTLAVPGDDVLTYTIVVSNIGPSHVYSATVFDDLPWDAFEPNKANPSGNPLAWVCTATAGSSCNGGSGNQINDTVTLTVGGLLTYTVTGKLEDDADGMLYNTAVVTPPVWVSDTDTTNNSSTDEHLLSPKADLLVKKMVDPPLPATWDSITYTLVVTNLGGSKAHSVTLTDTLPVGVSHTGHDPSGNKPNDPYDPGTGLWTIGDLRAHKVATLTIFAQVTETVVGTEIVNTAWGLTSTSPHDWNTSNNQDSATITVTAEASLSMVKMVTTPSAGPTHDAEADPGDTITYTLSFRNDGPNTAIGVVITDIVPVSLTSHTVISSGVAITPRLAGPQYVWDVENLAKDASGMITITGVLSKPLAAGPFTNTATITSTVRESYVGNNRDQAVVKAIHRADLAISKTATGPDGTSAFQIDAEPGDPVTYTLSFTNWGPYTATQVVITDQMPVSLTQRTVVSSGAVIVRRAAEPDYVWDVADLGENAGGTITITGVLSEPLAAGPFVNTATITTSVEEQEQINNSSQVTVNVVHLPDLVITKTVSGPGGSPLKVLHAEPGDRITYTLTYTNAGLGQATGVLITDIVPISVTQYSYSGSDPALEPISHKPDYVWSSSSLDPGEGGTITITGILSAPLDAGSFNNQATLSTSAFEPDAGDNSSDAVIDVHHLPHLAISKSVRPQANVAYHGEVTYTVILSNTGWGDAAGVRLTDTLPTEVAFARWAPGGPPAGASEAGDVIQWLGQVTGTEAITFTFLATHTGTYGDQVTNTAEYSHTSRSGSDDAVFRVQPTVTIAGPTSGVTNTAYFFTATVVPTAVFPITYTWQATDQSPTVHGSLSRLTDTISYTWLQTGTKTIEVGVSDSTVTITATHLITLP